MAAKASLQKANRDQITTPYQHFQFADSEIENAKCKYVTLKDEDKAELISMARTIPGTHKLHSFRSVSYQATSVRMFSFAPSARQELVNSCTNTAVASSSTLSGYVTCNVQWFLVDSVHQRYFPIK